MKQFPEAPAICKKGEENFAVNFLLKYTPVATLSGIFCYCRNI